MRAGETFADRYEVEHIAGTGGMGMVYRGRDLITNSSVAVKVLHRWAAAEAQRFDQESQVLAELSHDNIVRYVGHGTTPAGESYLVMEWLEGISLGQRLARERLSVSDCVTVGLRVAHALAAAHRRQIVHRDINPNNLFLPGGAIERVKVLDFGIARRVRRRGGTNPGTVVGTLGYMAPEQARGVSDIDARADVFSLGCVLYECLTGQPAFVGNDVMAILAKILLEETPRVRELCGHVSPLLADLVERAMAKEPDGRPADGAMFAEELEMVAGTLGDGADWIPPAFSGAGDAGMEVRTGEMDVPGTGGALSGAEQRVLSVVLVGGPRRDAGATLAASTSAALSESRVREETLRQASEPYGARLEVLADGSMVITLTGVGTAADQATSAARCALALRALVVEAPMALVTRRGVMSGRLPLGEVIDHGARVLREGVPGAIHIDDVAAGLLEARFEVSHEPWGPFLRGERDVLEAPRTVLGKTTACLGRDRELSLLEGIFEECAAEPVARVVLVTALAGMGKTRVRHEFLRWIKQRPDAVELLFAQGEVLSADSPFGMIGSAIRRAAGIVDGEAIEVRRKKLLARVARYLPSGVVRRVAEFLGELASVPFADEASPALRAARHDARLMGDAMRAAWQDWLEAECTAHPVVLLLEDLHWGDLPSVEFVDAALRSLRERPLLVLAFARPDVQEHFPALWAEREPQEVRLGRLTRKASERLVRQVLGTEVGDNTVARVVERGDGNPFYLEELVRAVASGSGDSLPDTVLGMVQARLDLLGTEPKRVLRAASVFGQTFWRGGLIALLGGEERGAGLGGWIDELLASEMIFAHGAGAFPGETEYVFRHGLHRDAAYNMLTDADRALGHRLAGEWLVRMGDTDAIVLAEHFDRGGVPAQALGWYRRGAGQALEGNDLEAAISRAERAVACGADGEALVASRLIQAQAHFWRARYPEAEGCALLAADAAIPGSSQWFLAAAEMIAALGQQGRYERVEEWARRTTNAAPTAQAVPAQLACFTRAAGYLIDAGRSPLAVALLAQVEAVPGGLGGLEPLVAAGVYHAHAKRAIHVGDLGAALSGYESALGAFERAGDARSTCENRVNFGYVCAELGDYARAEESLEQARVTAERMGLHYVAAGAVHNLGPVLAQRGDLVQARAVEQRAIEFFRGQGDRRLEGMSQTYLSTIAFLAGDLAEAVRQAEAAAELLRPVPPARASALAALSRALFAAGDLERALAVAEEAMGLLETLGGIEDYEALLRLVLAEALAALGRGDEAKRVIERACERLDVRASRIGDARWRDSFLTRVPDSRRSLELARSWGVIGRSVRRSSEV